MNNISQTTNYIQCYDNILDNNILNSLWEKYKKFPFTYYWKSNKEHQLFHWNHSLIKSSGKNIEDIQNQFDLNSIEAHFWQFIKTKHPNCSMLRAYVNAYTYGTDPAPHTDSIRNNEITYLLYLNNNWNPVWCGETVIFNKQRSDIEKAFIPKFNRFISFPSNHLHSARPIHKLCNELRIVLVFKISTDDKYTKYLKSVGAYNTPHSQRTLAQHLWGTYDILYQQNQPEFVCLAGLFHSIYGTVFFNHKSEHNRNNIKQLIGEQAENLVWLFSNFDRINQWQNSNIDNNTLNYLISINNANKIEQLNNIPHDLDP
jgi:hypothetical protein